MGEKIKKLHFDYRMQVSYSEPMSKCYYTIKCIPAESIRQHIERMQLTVRPDTGYERGEDSFGNQTIYGAIWEPHESFLFQISGVVRVDMSAPEPDTREPQLGMYRYPHGLVQPGAELLQYFQGIHIPEHLSDYERGVFLMHRLYKDFTYEKNVTTIATDAEQAWKLKRGVCQDYAHILVALCRFAGIPARYVTGFLVGEGFSHAWVEIYDNGYWFGLDPTNDLVVEDSHIKIGAGRDAADCMINRGILIGSGTQTQEIHVSVKPIG